MPQITRLNDVTYRSYRGFSLPSAVPAFGRFNLIYGWNASGKTTLSSLFRKIEKKESLLDGAAKFLIDGRPCDLCTINADTLLPSVRVFNRDFIEANILTSQLAPIFYLGEDSVSKQKQVELLRKEVAETKTKQGKAKASLSDAGSALNTFCSQQAKLVKEVLSSSGGQNPYNNYHKGDFKAVCKKIAAANTKGFLPLAADLPPAFVHVRIRQVTTALSPV
jgi:wobble nucleotide-excising tRNase